MECVLSERGNPLLLVNSHKFYKKCATTVGVKWCCTVRTCTAKIFVDEGQKILLKEEGVHNHEVNKRLQRQIISNAAKRKALEDVSERPKKILYTEIRNSAHASNLTNLDIYSIRKRIYDSRRSVLPSLPQNMQEVHEQLQRLNLKTNKGENFVLVNNIDANVIIFATTTNIRALCASAALYVDGTFKCCTKFFLQLFTVHGIFNGHYIPLAFCLLKDKTRTSYRIALESLAQEAVKLGEELKPRAVFADFEEAIHGAVKIIWNDTEVKGCRFHLGQSWWRKIQKLGLSEEYKNDQSEIGNWLKWIFGLPFLNPEDVGECFLKFMEIRPNCERIVEFSDYIVESYIEEESKFPPTMWACCTASSELTTNACESFHSQFNSFFYANHPNLFVFIEVLKNMQIDTYVKLNSISTKRNTNNKIWKRKIAMLEENIVRYSTGRISMMEFVKRASFNMKKIQ